MASLWRPNDISTSVVNLADVLIDETGHSLIVDVLSAITDVHSSVLFLLDRIEIGQTSKAIQRGGVSSRSLVILGRCLHRSAGLLVFGQA